MKRSYLNNILTWTLALLSVLIIILTRSANEQTLAVHPELVMYGFLTAFALYFSVQLNPGELSMAHVVGIMAFLSYPAEARHLSLLVIFFGGISGGLLMVLRSLLQSPSQRRVPASIQTLVHVTARVTISYYVASSFYVQTNAQLPLNNDPILISELWNTVAAVILFVVLYTLIYALTFVIQLYTDNYAVEDILRKNVALITFILLGIVPFAILAALAPSAQNSIVSFAIIVAGTMFSIFGLHAVSRVNYRVQKQFEEMRSLSRVSQAMTGNLNLELLLKTTYEQIRDLLNTNRFKLVLYASGEQQAQYAYVVEDGKEITPPPNYIPSDHGLMQRVLATRSPLLMRDPFQDDAKIAGINVPQDIYSWLGTPLLSGENIIGALSINSNNPTHHFSAKDQHLLTIIAGYASIAIENARLYEQKSHRAEQLDILNKVATLLSETLLPDNVIDIIISSASTITDATAVALYLPIAGRKLKLSLIRSAGFSDQFNQNPPRPIIADRLHNYEGNGKKPRPAIIPNINDADALGNVKSIIAQENKKAWVELPLTMAINNCGVIALYFDEPQNFSDEQIGVMEAFATQATQAINNAQTYALTDEALERRIEQLYALAAMGRLLTATTDVQKICDVVLNYASDATKAKRAFVALCRPHSDKIDTISSREFPADVIQRADILGQGINAQVLEKKQAFRSDDVRQETGYLPLIPDTRSLLIVPLLKGSEVFGLIRLEHSEPFAFSDGDAHFVSQIANQTMIAMDNTVLFYRIRNARDSLQTILDGMEDGIIMISIEQNITLANPSITMLGIKPEDLIQKSVDSLLRDDNIDFLYRLGFKSSQELDSVLKNLNHSHRWHELASQTYDIATEEGIRYFKRQIIPIHDEDDNSANGLMMVYYDKTEERQLEQTRDALSQMIIHDLRSPLTAVTTSLALLRAVTDDENKLKPIVDKTTAASQQAIQKVLSRINSLLDISKMESGEINIQSEPAELATIVDNVLIELSPLAHDSGIKLVSSVSPELPLLNIDSDKIERVLQNLIDNAIKYSPSEGHVTLQARLYLEDNEQDFIRIDIIDSGPGIPDNYKQSIFNRYVQIKERTIMRRGVGLGLTFCRMVTEAHGGKIWIEDNPDGGSIFALTLPIVHKLKTEKKQTV